MGIKETLRKAAGLLVELPREEPTMAAGVTPAGELNGLLAALDGRASGRPAPTGTSEETAPRVVGPNREPAQSAGGEPVPVAGEGQGEFASIYRNAGLPAAGFSAEQMLEMLASLPAELPLDTRRHTVRVSLGALGKSLGATPESIVSDASRKRAALKAYTEQLNVQTREQVTRAEQEIEALEAQTEEKRQAIRSARIHLSEVTRNCEAESERLDGLLEFFNLDVPR